ncbi:hypothetical protein FKM82_020671 [Ascaphus truei]
MVPGTPGALMMYLVQHSATCGSLSKYMWLCPGVQRSAHTSVFRLLGPGPHSAANSSIPCLFTLSVLGPGSWPHLEVGPNFHIYPRGHSS